MYHTYCSLEMALFIQMETALFNVCMYVHIELIVIDMGFFTSSHLYTTRELTKTKHRLASGVGGSRQSISHHQAR